MDIKAEKILVANRIEDLYNGLKEGDPSNNILSIKVQDSNKLIQLKEIDFQPIYNQCQTLKLQIKSIVTGQEDYDIFFECFSYFKCLKQLNIKFYNKQVQFLDSLLLNLKNIEMITLNFKNFRKICLKEQYKDKSFLAKNLNINLKNAIIDKKSIQNFSDFIGSHQNLQNLEIYMDKQCSFDILNNVYKQSNIQLSLKAHTKQQCDYLIELNKQKKFNKLEIFEYTEICQTLQEYLQRNGIKFIKNRKLNFFDFKDRVDIRLLELLDYSLLEEIPYIVDNLKERSKINKSIKILFNDLIQFKKYLLNIVDELFDKIQFQYSFYSYNKITKKEKYSWQIEIPENSLFDFFNDLNSIVFLNLKFDNKNHKNKTLIFEFLKKQQYLISLQIPSQITGKKIVGITNLIQQNSQIFLSYQVFRKQIFDLIPIPNQIFYDLIQKD